MGILSKLGQLAVAGASLIALQAWAQTQGVTDNEIVVGTVQDLSGPLAGYGLPIEDRPPRVDLDQAADHEP